MNRPKQPGLESPMGDDFLRDLVAGERAALVPRRGAREATWASVMQSVGDGAAPPIDAAQIPGPVGGSGGVASWLKIIVALALGGAAVVTVVVANGGGAREPPAVAERAAVASPNDEEERTAAPPVEPVPDEEIADTGAAIEPVQEEEATSAALPSATVEVTQKRASKTRPAARESEPAATQASEPAASALAEEARLLAAARRALGRGAHAEALAKLSEHKQRFADGQLAEDRIALRARVHCDRGDLEQGRRAAAELRRAYPRSSQLARIDRECKARG